jgi:DNA polymerase-3 subunit beta
VKIKVKRKPLVAALSAAAAIAPTRSARPTLRNALLVPDGVGLEIQATDMEVGIRYRIVAESIDAPAAVCLPAATLAGLLKECDEDEVELNVDGAKCSMQVDLDRFEVIGHPAGDFPEVPKGSDEGAIVVRAKRFAELIDRTIAAAAREAGRYAIHGVYLQCTGKVLEVVATDGRRLAYVKATIEKGIDAEGVVVPLKMMQEARKLCEVSSEECCIRITTSNRRVCISNGQIELSSLVVDGTFPKYQQVIPKKEKLTEYIGINREAVIGAIRKALYMVDESTNAVTLSFTNRALTISAVSPDKGAASVALATQHEGRDIEIRLNPRYLLDGLTCSDCETLVLELIDATRPAVIVEHGECYNYVMMPINPKQD